MILRAMKTGAIIGFVFGIIVAAVSYFSTTDTTFSDLFDSIVGSTIIFSGLAIPFRKWILRTFWV